MLNSASFRPLSSAGTKICTVAPAPFYVSSGSISCFSGFHDQIPEEKQFKGGRSYFGSQLEATVLTVWRQEQLEARGGRWLTSGLTRDWPTNDPLLSIKLNHSTTSGKHMWVVWRTYHIQTIIRLVGLILWLKLETAWPKPYRTPLSMHSVALGK